VAPLRGPLPARGKKTEYLDDRIPRPAAQPLHAMPVTGRIVRDNARSPDSMRYALAALLTALVRAVKTRGPVCPCASLAGGHAGDGRAAGRHHPGLTMGEMPLGPFPCPALSVAPAAEEAS